MKRTRYLRLRYLGTGRQRVVVLRRPRLTPYIMISGHRWNLHVQNPDPDYIYKRVLEARAEGFGSPRVVQDSIGMLGVYVRKVLVGERRLFPWMR